jgi:hypothetical protein
METFRIPPHIKSPAEQARYCRDKAVALVSDASRAPDAETRFALLSAAERWMTMAFHCRREAGLGPFPDPSDPSSR